LALSTLHPQSATFISPAHGWVYGSPRCAVPFGSPQAELAETKDRGRTWHLVPGAPSRNSYSANHFSGVRFANAKDGFIYGDKLYVTHDGGTTWATKSTPGFVDSLEVSDGKLFALIAGPKHGLFSATTADPTLVRVPSVDGDILVLHGRTVSVVDSLDGRVWRSIDGRHFSPVRAPCSGPSALTAWSDSGLALICGAPAGLGEEPKSFFVSLDGGAHWLPRTAPDDFGYIDSLSAASAEDLAFGIERGSGAVTMTHDGGRTWKRVPVKDPAGASLQVEDWTSVGFTDQNHGFALPSTPPPRVPPSR